MGLDIRLVWTELNKYLECRTLLKLSYLPRPAREAESVWSPLHLQLNLPGFRLQRQGTEVWHAEMDNPSTTWYGIIRLSVPQRHGHPTASTQDLVNLPNMRSERSRVLPKDRRSAIHGLTGIRVRHSSRVPKSILMAVTIGRVQSTNLN